jgi:glycosyltransferase involved in cell wall biosynthesis
MKRQRVVVVTDTMYPWFVGGKEERLRNLHGSIDDEKFEVIFATMKWWDGATPNQHFAICKKLEIYKNGRRSLTASIYFALACFKVISLKPDLVEADQIPFLQIWPLKLVCFAMRIPLCVTWHEVWGAKYWREYLGPLGFLAAVIERLSMKLPNKIIAVSALTKDRLISAGVNPSKISLINNFVDSAEIRKAKTNLPATDLLFVGRLISHKRVDLLLEAIALLKKEEILPTIAIVGSGPESVNLKLQALKLGIDSQIKFYDSSLESMDIWGMMGNCQIFLSASEREGYGIAVLEAITAGAKAIVSNHPDNASRFLISRENGKIVPEQTPKSWADSIKSGLATGVHERRNLESSPANLENFGFEYMENWTKVLATR